MTYYIEFTEIPITINKREIIHIETVNGRRTCVEFPSKIFGLMPSVSSLSTKFNCSVTNNTLEVKFLSTPAQNFFRVEYISNSLFIDNLYAGTGQLTVYIYTILEDIVHALEIKNIPTGTNESPCIYHIRHC
jgi:hypothetical protein